MHWLAIHFPALALEALLPDHADRGPHAVITHERQRRVIHCANAAAAAAGVQAGQAIASARALCADLRLLERDPERERQTLERLAAWGWRFSDQLSQEPPDLLLIEIARSQKLFGGARALIDAVRKGLKKLDLTHRYCAAPTPAGAALLARAGYQCNFRDPAALRRALAHVRLDLLPLERQALSLLHDSGLRHAAELLQLPRDELQLRLGRDFVAWLDRLEGRLPDPRPHYRPPPRFERRLNLPADAESTHRLRFAVQRLLHQLCDYLNDTQQAALRLDWQLHFNDGEESGFSLHLPRPRRDTEALMELMRERLERIELVAPVRELELRVTHLEPWAGEPGELFDNAGAPDSNLPARLCARLGDEAVRGLTELAEHRPEYASREPRPEEGAGAPLLRRVERPAWLLPRARRLAILDGRPWLQGPLRIESDVERIESGWWDAHPMRRDYYLARDSRHRRLWIYHDLRNGGWFLHGLFD